MASSLSLENRSWWSSCFLEDLYLPFYRVGALRVGDRIVSINGKPMKDQTVSFAIKQLQYGGDVIALTICRGV